MYNIISKYTFISIDMPRHTHAILQKEKGSTICPIEFRTQIYCSISFAYYVWLETLNYQYNYMCV